MISALVAPSVSLQVRSIGGAIVLAIVLPAIYLAWSRCSEDNFSAFLRVSIFFLACQLVLQVLEVGGIELIANRGGGHYFLPIISPTGFFAEPSHLAISYSPYLLLLLIWDESTHSRSLRYVLACMLCSSLLLSLSSTAIFVVLAGLIIAFVPKGNYLILSFALVATLIMLNIDALTRILPIQVQARILPLFELLAGGAEISNHTNTTAATFYSGFVASMSTLKAAPFGFGFLNMSQAYDLPELATYRNIFGNRNIEDGSSILFKVVTEFGIFGILMIVIATCRFYKALSSGSDIYFMTFSFPFFAYFMRGASYFDGPIIIGIAVLLFYRSSRLGS
ncbi:hypothetical protein [Sulfitobacter sp. 1A16808]|uniref:hypothetical protein n=1 Tax=Sulfitobacter sp. 1A16808 TaxID=3368572 RepID=UPI003749A9C5